METKLGRAINTIKQWDYDTLEGVKYLLMISIVVDLFGIYWWLELKRLGITLIVLIMVFLAFTIIMQSRLIKSTKEVKTNDIQRDKSN